ncbi:transmembrane protein, putative [Medicago truncatula]|uniref:Transmembrane protein, putative n=1 Tax=Medicago truncatula TaxID=3880 RepID=G7JX69_MEDTR|nr:transmembrane protein, putative [Medicago truncatula]
MHGLSRGVVDCAMLVIILYRFALTLQEMYKKQMFCLMFQHRVSSKHKQNSKKVNDKKVNGTESLLSQFGTTHLHLGATKPGRKSISLVRILKLSANSSFTLKTYDLPALIST